VHKRYLITIAAVGTAGLRIASNRAAFLDAVMAGAESSGARAAP
jgi:hypothetical protein